MLKQKMISIALLTIFSSCQLPALIAERCVIAIDLDYCRCHQFDFVENRRVSDSENKPLDYCNRQIVLPSESYASLIIWIEEVKRQAKKASRRLYRNHSLDSNL